MSLKQTLIIIFSLILITTGITTLFGFLGVEFSTYGNYLIWIWVLIILYYTLPENKSIFIS
jgi:hypothetical protein